jgi:hypothetical protein
MVLAGGMADMLLAGTCTPSLPSQLKYGDINSMK